jgi:two-component system, cell cycle response regulator
MSNSSKLPPVGATLVVDQTRAPDDPKRGALTVMAGAEAGRVYPLPDAGVVVLGRSPDCQLQFDDASVSGRHAQIARIGGVYVFVDQRSTNGSFVNDVRATGPVHLNDGDRIRVGQNALLRFSLMEEREQAALSRVYEAALRDGLTGVYNRKHLDERLEAEINAALRTNTPLSVVMIDIDFFKRVNDTFGHPGGDEVLRRTAAAIEHTLRAGDFLARYGGEEFTVVARSAELVQARDLAERIRRTVEANDIPLGPQTIRVSISLGVASLACTGGRLDRATLMGMADRRLYVAKQSGRNRVMAQG